MFGLPTESLLILGGAVLVALVLVVIGIFTSRSGKKWRRQLSRADLKLTVAEFFALHFISMTGFFAGAYFVLFRGDLIFSVIAAFLGFFAPRIFVARKISTRLIQFEQQLPDTLGARGAGSAAWHRHGRRAGAPAGACRKRRP
jgi:hypothetical protein